ncbi:MAG TPA: pyridoxamine 5'-phosphate oxidase family protein [Solirubrobacteraceae bacterium]|nr:pyridoxamine 5'-phosphate oxidase family protein [Solirubrobacteraceae bacterium]
MAPSRRDQITMTGDEVAAFVAEQRTLICATNGPDGWPHLMPLWYVVRGEDIWAWTYAASQKVRNLERDDRATLQVEAGDSYDQLRGVMITANTEIVRDPAVVAELGAALAQRYAGTPLEPAAREAIRGQATRRVALRFLAQRVASWDHRKLAGAY